MLSDLAAILHSSMRILYHWDSSLCSVSSSSRTPTPGVHSDRGAPGADGAQGDVGDHGPHGSLAEVVHSGGRRGF
jgi:hypothetical protein